MRTPTLDRGKKKGALWQRRAFQGGGRPSDPFIRSSGMAIKPKRFEWTEKKTPGIWPWLLTSLKLCRSGRVGLTLKSRLVSEAAKWVLQRIGIELNQSSDEWCN